ncbi:Lsr2 family protein [uncultured Nocardioides sp.]|uniref:histone-like nucleoid-structuring protein Lsr2 n=1 Tax=uncultured Nocardioides sp. TaxID=198441 RepID=UPI002602E081|nr:Lsr2 family protein [uncultured Nocardioides sp.]
MAQKVSITHVSDLSGDEIKDNDAPSLTFGWDGTEYSIDLTAKEAEKFYKAVEPYLGVATKVGKVKRSGSKKSTSNGPAAAEVRAWAKDNGYDVPDRGRIPSEVREAFDSAS